MATEEALQTVRMLKTQRWGALATIGDRGPMASMVSYALEPGPGILMFLSGMAQHTRNLDANPAASLAVTEGDGPEIDDPQTIPRVSVQGSVEMIPRDAEEFAAAWKTYVERFPNAAPRLGLGDFNLYRLTPDNARWVGGFAAARTIGIDVLREATEKIL